MAAEGSLPRLKAVIECYCRQTYLERELVVVGTSGPRLNRAVAAYIEELGRNDVRLLTPEPAHHRLGNPMVLGFEASSGPLACIWASNDLSHPRRLEIQAAHLEATGADVVSLSDRLCFLWRERTLYWVDHAGLSTVPELDLESTALGRLDVLRAILTSDARDNGASQAVVRHDGAGHCCVRLLGDLWTPHSSSLADALERVCRSVAEVQARREDLEEALFHYRLPRPYLIKGRLPAGDVTTIDAGQHGGAARAC
jgi:hypothetical protein